MLFCGAVLWCCFVVLFCGGVLWYCSVVLFCGGVLFIYLQSGLKYNAKVVIRTYLQLPDV